MNIKQIFESGWGFGNSFTSGLGAYQRPCESFHLYKQTRKKKKTHKKCLRQQEMFS